MTARSRKRQPPTAAPQQPEPPQEDSSFADNWNALLRLVSAGHRKAFRSGDAIGLVNALMLHTRGFVGWTRSNAAQDEDDYVEVPRWAVNAAIGYVLHGAGGYKTPGLVLSRRGGAGSLGRRMQQEARDWSIYYAVEDALGSESSLERAFLAVEDERRIPAGTVKRAFSRARRRLKDNPLRYGDVKSVLASMQPQRRSTK